MEEINDIKKSITEYLSHEKLSRACFLTRKQYEIILKGLDALSRENKAKKDMNVINEILKSLFDSDSVFGKAVSDKLFEMESTRK